jgi:hypothetical protein
VPTFALFPPQKSHGGKIADQTLVPIDEPAAVREAQPIGGFGFAVQAREIVSLGRQGRIHRQ